MAQNGCRGVSWPVLGGKFLPLYPLGWIALAAVAEAAAAREASVRCHGDQLRFPQCASSQTNMATSGHMMNIGNLQFVRVRRKHGCRKSKALENPSGNRWYVESYQGTLQRLSCRNTQVSVLPKVSVLYVYKRSLLSPQQLINRSSPRKPWSRTEWRASSSLEQRLPSP